MSDSLPISWKYAPIQDLLAPQEDLKLIHQGWSPKCHKEAAPEKGWGVLKTTAIQDGEFVEHENKRLPSDKEPRTNLEVKVGDLLLTCAGPRRRCGVATLVRRTRGQLMISGKMYRMRADDRVVIPGYIEAWLRAPEAQEAIDAMKTGINESGLNLTHDRFRQLPVRVPPLAEQEEIAAKLGELLTKVDTIKARLNAIPVLLKRFRQSVLAAAVSGRLTEGWRNQREIASETWPRVELQQVCEKHRLITYGVIKLGKEVRDGTPCLRTSNVRRLRFELDGLKKIDPNLSAEYSRTVLRGGEVLVNVRGTLGGVAVVDEDMAGWNVSREVAVVPVDPKKLSPKLLSFWLASDLSQNWLGRVKKGVAYVGINIKDLKTLPVGLPTDEEQAEIVRRVDQLFAFADQIEKRVQAAHNRVNRLTPSILAKAFRGELTAEWRAQHPELITGENSAEALLARIRTERAKAPKARRGRRKVSA